MGSLFSKRVRGERTKEKQQQKNICSPPKRTQPTKGEIETHAMKRVESILRDEKSKQLLKQFLQKGHTNDKSSAMIRLECYELCDRILSDLDGKEMFLDDLIEMCDTVAWENRIQNARTADTADEVNWRLEEVLNALKKECVNQMESDHDFTRFRLDLVKQYKK